jgi:hypothetical protein
MLGTPVDSRAGFYTNRNTDVTEKVFSVRRPDRGVPVPGHEPVAVL